MTNLNSFPVPIANVTDDQIPKYKYIIIGAGTAGTAAWEAIKENDPSGDVSRSFFSPHILDSYHWIRTRPSIFETSFV